MTVATFTIVAMSYNKDKRCTEITEEKAGETIIHNLYKESTLTGIAKIGDTITLTQYDGGLYSITKAGKAIAHYGQKEKALRDAFYEVENARRGETLLREQIQFQDTGNHHG
ncbi:hypothetical protein Oweho_3231 [Owenweeksia hongkongensis DSM 17368]|uniref:Uncharacterized protein n=1 Tax=Owenweeksia hongkongensis (strain DSM 17368 / CIP 108786 / JCM 12287 / NRRL B-23963 / UST20020801) TaxID=926562 RepID=G8R3U5_OWEHD|nr:hypothetical protein [Owenweeksia hongkongensis]AEV34182.1 hypothetical protein Oweho_3231 [Owenweeksia hongkongensis DSM 17368]